MAYIENKHGKFKSDLLLIAYVMYLVTVMTKIRDLECDDFFPTIAQSQTLGPFMRYLKQYNGSLPQQ